MKSKYKTTKFFISDTMLEAIKNYPMTDYKIANKVRINRELFSRWKIRANPIMEDDERIFKLAKFLGVPKNKIFGEKW
ncbi:MAG: hypothetical protein ACFFG0_05565 [Candidatus Thorarchaeota archaeon]